jgi:hypothetical protein
MRDQDFRADPMESPDGHGFARRAWQTYVRRSNQLFGPALRPLVEPSARKVSASLVTDLFGFWLLWHLEGGFEGLQRLGMSRSAIYRRVKVFRTLTGMHPDEYVLPGVEIDVQAYRKGKPTRRTSTDES